LLPERRAWRPVRLSCSELVCLAVAQALLGFHSEHRWIRFAICHLRCAFPYLPRQPGYSKRLRAALPLVKQAIRDLAADSDFWFDGVWIADSTPVECGRSRPAVKRPDLAGWADYGYCASHSRWFWGLRLYLIADLATRGTILLRPARKNETARRGEPLLKPIRQLIESVNDTLKGQLDLEAHGGRTFEGVAIRVAQRILAMAAAIWHNNKTGAPVTRSLIAYDH
jgi:hypothetical protein